MKFAGFMMDGAFLHGRNISTTSVVIELATEFGLEPERFTKIFGSETVDGRLAAALDFSGRVATGFPSVCLQAAEGEPLQRLGGVS